MNSRGINLYLWLNFFLLHANLPSTRPMPGQGNRIKHRAECKSRRLWQILLCRPRPPTADCLWLWLWPGNSCQTPASERQQGERGRWGEVSISASGIRRFPCKWPPRWDRANNLKIYASHLPLVLLIFDCATGSHCGSYLCSRTRLLSGRAAQLVWDLFQLRRITAARAHSAALYLRLAAKVFTLFCGRFY